MPSFIPPYNPNNVKTGVASMFTRPWSATVPAALPANTVALGGTWPTGWRSLGATDSGLEFQYSTKTNEIMIEEQVTQVDEVVESVKFSMVVTLAEDTMETMALAYGSGTIVATPAATGVPGVRQLTLASDIDVLAFGFEVQIGPTFWRRYLIPKVKSIADVKTSFVRAKDKRTYDVSINSLCAPEQVIILEKTAEAL